MNSLKQLFHPKCPFRHLGTMAYSSVNEKVKPRITVPHRMMKKIEKIKLKHLSKRHQQSAVYKGPVVISCKRKQFDHYAGQTYTDFNPQHMASGAWKHRGSVGDYFTINACGSNPAQEMANEADLNFRQLGICEALNDGLQEMGIAKPSNIQAMVIPEMLRGSNVICVAETGCGKTLAYLLPMLEKIKQHQLKFGKSNAMNSPYAVILVPSNELAEQILEVSNHFARYLDFKPHCVLGMHGIKSILKWGTKIPMDVVIATPGVFNKVLSHNLYKTSNLIQVVLDEADSLLDDSFNSLTCRIVRKLQIVSEKLEIEDENLSTVGTQVALVGATVPRDLEGIFGDIVPLDTIKVIKTDFIHQVLPHVSQKFLRISRSKKPEVLMNTLADNLKRKIPTVVFCNSNATACFLSYFLEENIIAHVLLCSSIPNERRRGQFQRFQNGEVDVIICTDLASRGLDTSRAQHVINYDFPSFISDYVHRVGRVGRLGSKGSGHCLSFVAYPYEVELLWIIETSVRKSTEFYNVNANIKRKLEGRYEQE